MSIRRRRGSLVPFAGESLVPRRSGCDPTGDAPALGRYQLLNIFGAATDAVASARKGERLPAAPRGYSWRLVAINEPLEAARRRLLVLLEPEIALIQINAQAGDASETVFVTRRY
jgi:hypothetical protein